jgi:3-deoxy-D-manno-octulosonic-acid transferase
VFIKIPKTQKKIELIEKFCGNSNVFIAGSTWLPDEKLLVSLIEKHPDWRIIIAPHEVDEQHINEIEKLFPTAKKFSSLNTQYAIRNTNILIIDNIGMLSSLYQYAKVAYIGGGFGAGIHNTLEAAAFGLPVIFGPKYDKFQEAKDLIAIGAAKSISNAEELIFAFEYFNTNTEASADAKKYVNDKKGATKMILKLIDP